jgi:hypothetical protein
LIGPLPKQDTFNLSKKKYQSEKRVFYKHKHKHKRTLGLGNNIPATKTMLVGTKHDIRKGKKTASPVSG